MFNRKIALALALNTTYKNSNTVTSPRHPTNTITHTKSASLCGKIIDRAPTTPPPSSVNYPPIMPLLTLLARVSDGLILAESMDSGKSEIGDTDPYRTQAKQIFRTLNRKSPPRMFIESGSYYFSYVSFLIFVRCE